MGTKAQLMLGKYLDLKMVIPTIGFIAAIAVAHSNLQRVVKDVDVLDSHGRDHETSINQLKSDVNVIDRQVKENGADLKALTDEQKVMYGGIIELKTLVGQLKD